MENLSLYRCYLALFGTVLMQAVEGFLVRIYIHDRGARYQSTKIHPISPG